MKAVNNKRLTISTSSDPNDLEIANRDRIIDYTLRSSWVLDLLDYTPLFQEWYHMYLVNRANRKYKRYLNAKRKNK